MENWSVLPGRSPGEDAEWDRNRVEEEPALWDAALLDKLEQELPDEVEPCLTAGRCRPVFQAITRSWRCDHCSAKLVLMKEVKDAV